MDKFTTRLASVLVFIVAASGLPGTAAVHSAEPTMAIPGNVTAHTPLTHSALPPGAGKGWKLTYSTVGERGEPRTSTGVFFEPQTPPPAGGYRLVSLAHGTTGIGNSCKPSVTLAYRTSVPVQKLLRSGYAVAITDYQDIHGVQPYLATASAAHSVIDIVRAAHHLDPSLYKRWFASGHSQGGHAALAAGNAAPSYAPEYPLAGVFSLAPPSEMDSVASMVGPQLPSLVLPAASELVSYILAGVIAAHPEGGFDQLLSPLGKRMVALAPQHCVLDGWGDDVSIKQLFTGQALSAQQKQLLHSYWSIPTAGWRVPVIIAQGTADMLITPKATTALVGQLHAGGANVVEKLYPGADHGSVVNASAADFTAFILSKLPPR